MKANPSGIKPVEFKVLILPAPVEQRTVGGIIIPDDPHERDQWAQVKGTLAAKGGRAFEDWPEDDQPYIGSLVYFRKYEGILIMGADGKEYRLCTDKDIGAVVEDEKAFGPARGRTKGGLGAVA